MTSRASCCNGTLLRKNITRFWPLWALFTLALLVAYPMILSISTTFDIREAVGTLYGTTFHFGICITAIYSIISAACLFRYLHNTRSSYMLHAFPVTRGSLFFTNVLSGLLFFLVPVSFVSGLCLLILIPCGTAALNAMLFCWLILCLAYLFFFGLAVFCMYLTGKTVSGVLIYAVMNFIVIAIEGLLQLVIQPALYGVGISSDAYMLPTSPAVYLISEVLTDTYIGPEYYHRAYSIDWIYVGAIAAVGIGFLAGAWLLYRRRHMENAGEVITVKWAKPIYQVIFALVGALTIGLLIAAILTNGGYGDSPLFLVFWLSFGGFIGWFVAEMRLKKTVKVFRGRVFLGFGCYAVALSLFVLAFYWDWFGIVHKVPEIDEISTVEIRKTDYTSGVIVLDTVAEIKEAQALHRSILDIYDNDFDYDYYYRGSVELTYCMKDGSSLTRSYPLYRLESAPELLAQSVEFLDRPSNVIEFLDSFNLRTATWAEYYWYDEMTGYYCDYIIEGEELTTLLDALYQDAADGNLPIFFGLDDGFGRQLQFELENGRYYYILVSSEAATATSYLDSINIEEKTK